MAIPRKIHYCWFGHNPKPKLAEKCIKSWKKHCDDYEIIEWNEENFDISSCPLYVRQAYQEKKWAFVTDYARLKILYENGGIYFDTDVQLLKNLDELLSLPAFMGIERSKDCVYVNTGLAIGAEKGNPLIKAMADDYEDTVFIKEDGSYDITTCTVKNTAILREFGYIEEDRTQKIEHATVFSSEYFSPIDMTNGKMYKTKNTLTIHHYSLSWTSEEHRKERKKNLRKLKQREFIYNLKVLPNNVLFKIFGKERYQRLKNKLRK